MLYQKRVKKKKIMGGTKCIFISDKFQKIHKKGSKILKKKLFWVIKLSILLILVKKEVITKKNIIKIRVSWTSLRVKKMLYIFYII